MTNCAPRCRSNPTRRAAEKENVTIEYLFPIHALGLAVGSAETRTKPRNMRSLSTWCARHTSKLIVHQQKLTGQKRIYYSLKTELQGGVLGRGYQNLGWRAWKRARGARAIALGGNDRDFRPSRARAFHGGARMATTNRRPKGELMGQGHLVRRFHELDFRGKGRVHSPRDGAGRGRRAGSLR
jgi:hypothetical protein